MAQSLPDDVLARIGNLAVAAYLAKRTHEGNDRLHRLSQVGPGALQESAHTQGVAEGELARAIEGALADEERKAEEAGTGEQTSAQTEGQP